MNIQEYIASGVLESYALNDLSTSERQEVERMLSQHAELRDELDLIEEGLEVLAMETAVTPPAHLKGDLFAALDLPLPEANTQEHVTPEDADIVPVAPKRSNIWAYVTAASVSIALVSSFMAYDFYNRWQQTARAYLDIADSNEILALKNQQVNRVITDLEESYKVLVSPDFSKITMGSVIEGEGFTASVYWNQKTEEAYLSIGQLKKLTKEQQYQLWAIVDGKPVDMGIFDGTENMLTRMKPIAGAVTFAVTIEPKGGSVNPTLDQMQVAGNVS